MLDRNRKQWPCLCFLLTSCWLWAGDPVEEAKDILLAGEPRAKLLILGTFHFKDAGLDNYKPEHEVDILSKKRQAEVKEVVNLLAAFKPTKVAVEWKPEYQAKTDENFQAYLEGTFELKSNEVYQLGFRLAKQLGHRKVHLVDAAGRWFEKREDIEAFAKKNGQTDLANQPWDARYDKLYKMKDARKMKTTLREHLNEINREEMLLMSHGHYLVGGFAVGDGETFPGVDGFVSSWYNRNLRIFSNLVRLVESPRERILLIIGAGHVPVIRHAAQASPQIELLEISQFLGK